MNQQPHDHIVRSYDEEQRRLQGELLRMGAMAAAQLEAALDVVDRRDDRAAQRIVDNDVAIDQLEHETSQDVMKLTLRGPLARDMRQILASLRIASDIERIGDYAANVAKRSIALNAAPPLPHTLGLRALGTLALRQLDEVLAEDVQLILLDNFPVWQTQIAVQRRNANAPGVLLESSGGLSLDTAGEYAGTGVDYLAVGALTHSVRVLDVGLDL